MSGRSDGEAAFPGGVNSVYTNIDPDDPTYLAKLKAS